MKTKKLLAVTIAALILLSIIPNDVYADVESFIYKAPGMFESVIRGNETADVEALDPEFAVVRTEATGVREVTVTMSTSIPEGTTVTLKKGTIGIVTTKAFDGPTAVLTGLFNFNPGTYTVTVGEEVSEPFEITARTATEITISAETIFMEDSRQDLRVRLADQYGDAMNLFGVNASVFNQDTGYVFPLSLTTTITINATDDINAEAGDTIYIFVYDPVSQLQMTCRVILIEARELTAIEIKELVPGEEEAPRLYAEAKANKIDIEGTDQYGNPFDITRSMLTDGTIQYLVSDTRCVDLLSLDVRDGDIYFDAEETGTLMFIFILPMHSFVAKTEIIEVYPRPVLDSLEITGPAEIACAGEEIDFAAAGYDQYGNPIDFDNGDDIDFIVSNSKVITSGGFAITDTNEITMTPHGDGTVSVFVLLGGEFQGQADITVNPEAYPFAITAVEAHEAMQEGTSFKIKTSDISVIDQYGREMSSSKVFDTLFECGYYHFFLSGGGDSVSLSEIEEGIGYELISGTKKGTDSFTAYLEYSGCTIHVSSYKFEVSLVHDEDIVYSMSLAEAGTMYTGNEFEWGQKAEDYYKNIVFKGTTEQGKIVLLDTSERGVPQEINIMTSSNDAVEISSGTVLVPGAAVEGSATIKAWRDGEMAAQLEVGLCASMPVLASIETSDSEIDWGSPHSLLATAFEYHDQYYVELDGYALCQADILIYDFPDSAADYMLVDKSGTWWFASIKHDGTVWKRIDFRIEYIFPAG